MIDGYLSPDIYIRQYDIVHLDQMSSCSDINQMSNIVGSLAKNLLIANVLIIKLIMTYEES